MRKRERRRTVLWSGVPAVTLIFVAAAGCAGKPAPAPATAATTRAGGAPPASGPSLAKTAAALPVGSPLVLLPAAVTRPMLLTSISITSVDHLLTSGAKLVAQAVPLPIDPSGLRDLLLSQAGLPPEVAANLDFGSPSGAVLVALGRAGRTGLVMAVAARGTAEAERVIAALGRVVMKRGEAVLVDNGSGGRGWIWRAGSVIVLSDDVEALARGAMLALEARHPVSQASEDVTAVVYPEALARANGTDVKTALGRLGDEMRALRAGDANRAGGPGAAPLADQSYDALMEILGLIADVDTAEIGLALDPARGLGVRARIHPRRASKLETVAREAHPFVIDAAALRGAPPPAMVMADGSGSLVRGLMVKQRDHLAAGKEKGTAAALAFFDAMLEALTGQITLSARVLADTPHFEVNVVYPLKDAATAGKMAAALGRIDRAAAAALWNAQLGKDPGAAPLTWSVKKETVGKLKALHVVFTPRKDAAGAETLQNLMGRGLDCYLAVAGTRLLATVGKDARAELVALSAAAGGAGAPGAGPLANALGAARGRDGFFFFDVGALLSLAGALGSTGARAELFARGAPSIPIYATTGGDGAGRVWTLDLTVPPDAFAGAGVVVGKLVGHGMGAPAPSIGK
jgi:hypothetical protein